ncbi:MAG: DUF484 family protein [Zoogloeaceae bacterium]|jgi:uncharacterized protein YigA (DUF484 family)|nr:DUF484 family protein [Zoogloeaceae bacterium]
MNVSESPKAAQVAGYLQDHPQFFEQYADLLADIRIPHPHGGRTISLSERQMVALREKNRKLERNLAELLRFGEVNDALGEKMHRFSVALVAAETLQAVLHLVRFHLCDDFAIPHVALRLWQRPENIEDLPEFAATSEALQTFAETLHKPYCGPVDATLQSTVSWFGDVAAHIRSQALIALRNGGGAIGMIALGSEEVERFYPDMGTLYLERLGELASAALARVTHSAL